MANDIGGRVWKLDTPSASSFVLKSPVKIDRVEWCGPKQVGDTFLITDAAGKEILSRTCQVAADDTIEINNINCWYTGIKLNILDRGYLKIHNS